MRFFLLAAAMPLLAAAKPRAPSDHAQFSVNVHMTAEGLEQPQDPVTVRRGNRWAA